jgi:hypothetical protein
MRLRIAIIVIAVRICAQSSYPIETIEFKGTTYPRAALLAATGLHTPMPFSEPALRDAAQRLQNTGFFRTVQFRYGPARGRSGYMVRFDLTEDTDSLPARIDIPGFDEKAVWAALQAADPLLTRQVPSNDIAQSRYLHAIEEYVAQHGDAQKIAARTNGGKLGSDPVTLVFEPENLPIIVAVRFTDTYALKPTDLEAALEPIAANSGYTESRFRQLLDLNVRPWYEEQGFLGVVFDRIKLNDDDLGRLTVETHVIDGRAYALGTVTLDGPGLPEAEMRKAAAFHMGDRANWKEFLESVSEMERVLKRQGYLHEKSRVQRTLHSREGTVDAVIHFTPGPQYRFGALELSGMPEDVKAMARQRWTMREGQPLNAEYPYEFVHDLYKELRGARGKATVSFPPGEGENVLNVVIEFR